MNDFCYISSISRMYLLPSKALTEILSPLQRKTRLKLLLENCIVSDIVILEALSKVGEMDYFDEFLRRAQPWSMGPYNPIRPMNIVSTQYSSRSPRTILSRLLSSKVTPVS